METMEYLSNRLDNMERELIENITLWPADKLIEHHLAMTVVHDKLVKYSEKTAENK